MADSTKTLYVYADGKLIGQGNRTRVNGRSTMSLYPDTWQVDIFNLGNADSSVLKCAEKISVSSQNGFVCAGKVFDIVNSYENLAPVTTVTILDGADIWSSCVNASISSHTPFQRVLQIILNKSTPTFKTSVDGFNGARITRGISAFGRSCGYISSIAKQNGLLVFTYADTLYIRKMNNNVDIEIGDDDLMDEPQSMIGGYVIRTQVSSYLMGRVVRMDTQSCKGIYRIVAQTISADTGSGDWVSKLIIVSSGVSYD